MHWGRKLVVLLLSLILFVSLIGEAWTASFRANFSHPATVESWLQHTNFYSDVLNSAITQAQNNSSNDVGAGRVSLSDPEVEQAIKSVFSPQLLQGYAATFLDSNYAWLHGKTAQPDFTINLKPAKRTLANQISQNVQTHLGGLPACTTAQLTELQSTLDTDPMTVSCLPSDWQPQTIAQQVNDQITGSSDFLSHPVLTADAINPNGSNQGTPYYQKLSALPKAYRWALRLPWIFGALVILSLAGIIALMPRQRLAARRISWIAGSAGVVLIIFKLAADGIFHKIENHLTSTTGTGQFQQAATDVLRQAESHLTKVDLVFAIAYLVIATILAVIVFKTRGSTTPPTPAGTPSNPSSGADSTTSIAPPTPRPNRPPKPPHLIQ